MEKEKTNFFDSKFMKGLQHAGEKLAANKAVMALQSGFMGAMGIILVGAIFQIIGTIPTIFGWLTTDSAFYKFCMAPYNATMGLLSVYVVFMIAYTYSKLLGLKPLMGGVNALAIFILVAAPPKTVTLADGSSATVLDNSTMTLGAVGLFVAILIGIFSVKITKFCEKHNWVIRMSDVVPQFLQDAFSAVIPIALNVLVWHGLNTLAQLAMNMTLPMLISVILSIPLMAVNSVPGMFVIALIACLLWCFGIHGTMVVYIALAAVMYQNIAANQAAVAAGGQAIFYATSLFTAIATAGGTGDTFGLVLLGLKSKSKQIKEVSRVAVIPALFGINEPATFGYPIMYNPVLSIPYILTPMITMLFVWLGYVIGFFKPGYITTGSLMPIGVNEFLSALAWQNIFIPVIGIVVGLLVYAPFLKAYEKQLIEKEQAAEADEAAKAQPAQQ
ncbi:MAG: PTS transporter subunit EIIC [Oscillospiraceae bacterium]|nr:PTS transporter subunit EIIC [Oscillospiraceae bacterium]